MRAIARVNIYIYFLIIIKYHKSRHGFELHLAEVKGATILIRIRRLFEGSPNLVRDEYLRELRFWFQLDEYWNY
jgi:hypothetical protein